MQSNEVLNLGKTEVRVIRKGTLKNLYIHVDPPDGRISVKAPDDVSLDEIKLFALKKLPDIAKVRSRMREQPRQSHRRFVSGESHYYWGKPMMLQVVYGSPKASVRKSSSKIIMNVPEGTDEDARKHLLTEWYRSELKRVLPAITNKCVEATGIIPAEIKIKNMKTKWGTCNREAERIWLNLQLVKKPPECLEYVLIHELVHLQERNHTNRFHAMVEEYLPSWREAKNLLSTYPLDHLDGGAVADHAS